MTTLTLIRPQSHATRTQNMRKIPPLASCSDVDEPPEETITITYKCRRAGEECTRQASFDLPLGEMARERVYRAVYKEMRRLGEQGCENCQ